MANSNNPHGLRPLYVPSGGPIQTNVYSKAATLDTAIFRGDAVARVADGSISAKTTDITPGTTNYSGVSLNYGAASAATDHTVVDDPTVVFEAQADGALAEADMGLNANLVLTAGNTSTKISKHQVNSATEAVDATLDVHLARKLNVPDNDYGAYVRLEITFNKHRMAPATVGV